ncbi:uncharacterized protein SPSK_07750 [Sporothrix schenckii 1099-18]|uniref:Uncharacterized protein n=2 Tax=Sporothrix schenckii TaxID=29908 RepID=U7Q4P8_SPOS1|nr:uncharacterized protein SPSK_07750 [Sporothrix schenckii 1099-18]ERT01686.1 hypothetical protein HMPREF1624_02939 [Sporothrix schenckii ATCC 58251]KJR88918.1 hypothetical protein SPSK_07750 [Sporothrix schenckii 1099-18]
MSGPPSVFSQDGTYTTDGSSLSGFSVGPPPTGETALQKLARAEAERQTSLAMHMQNHMGLPPFAVNGNSLYDAHELAAADPARLISAADFQRQAETARLVFTNDPNRPWDKDTKKSKYPETIYNNQFGLPDPVLGHPIVGGPGTYAAGRPGASRVWSNAATTSTAELLYHNVQQGQREHQARLDAARQEERDLKAELKMLHTLLRRAHQQAEVKRLKNDIRQKLARRAHARRILGMPYDGYAPFTQAAFIPEDPECPPLVAMLANPHQPQFDETTHQYALPCQRCGARALINKEFEVVERCQCTSGQS